MNQRNNIKLGIRIKKRIGQQIRTLRIARSLTQVELAKLCKMPSTYISALERGTTNVTVNTLCRVARSLDCDISDLLGASNQQGNMTVDVMRVKAKAAIDKMPATRLRALLQIMPIIFT